MAKVTLEIDAEGGRAIRELVKMAQAQAEVNRQTEAAGRAARDYGNEQTRASETANAAIGKTLGLLRQFAPSLVGLASVGGALAALKKQFEDLDTALRKRAEQQIEFGGSGALRDLLLKFPADQGEARRLALRAGARQGFTAEEGAPTFMRFQGLEELRGNVEASSAAAEEALALQRLGATPEASFVIISEFIKQQRTAQEGSAALLAAAGRTPMGMTQFAGAMRGIREFADPTQGLAIGAQLSRTLNEPGELDAGLRQVGEFLNRESPFSKTLQQMLDADRLRGEGVSTVGITRQLGLKNMAETRELMGRVPEGISRQFGDSAAALDPLSKLALTRELFPEIKSGDVETIRTALQAAGMGAKQIKAFGELLGDLNWAELGETLAAMQTAMQSFASAQAALSVAQQAGGAPGVAGMGPAGSALRQIMSGNIDVLAAEQARVSRATKEAGALTDPSALVSLLDAIEAGKFAPKGTVLGTLIPTDDRGLPTPLGTQVIEFLRGKPDDKRTPRERLEQLMASDLSKIAEITAPPPPGVPFGPESGRSLSFVLEEKQQQQAEALKRHPILNIPPFEVIPIMWKGIRTAFLGVARETASDAERATRAGPAGSWSQLNEMTFGAERRALAARAEKVYGWMKSPEARASLFTKDAFDTYGDAFWKLTPGGDTGREPVPVQIVGGLLAGAGAGGPAIDIAAIDRNTTAMEGLTRELQSQRDRREPRGPAPVTARERE